MMTPHQNSSLATFSQLQTNTDNEDSSDIDENLTFEKLINEHNDVDTNTTEHSTTSSDILIDAS